MMYKHTFTNSMHLIFSVQPFIYGNFAMKLLNRNYQSESCTTQTSDAKRADIW